MYRWVNFRIVTVCLSWRVFSVLEQRWKIRSSWSTTCWIRLMRWSSGVAWLSPSSKSSTTWRWGGGCVAKAIRKNQTVKNGGSNDFTWWRSPALCLRKLWASAHCLAVHSLHLHLLPLCWMNFPKKTTRLKKTNRIQHTIKLKQWCFLSLEWICFLVFHEYSCFNLSVQPQVD